jgi:phosphoribosylformylglycinamidine synthase
MTDLLGGAASLGTFQGLTACGGFSYGDVLGAGAGWARSVLFNAKLRDTFSLGVCNGCQMLSLLKDLVPGAALWPRFLCDRSERGSRPGTSRSR